jgi:hypothetical protein
MDERRFAPVEPGPRVPVPQHRGGTLKSEERRQAGPPATLDQGIEKAFDITENTRKDRQRQAYPIRVLKRRYALSGSYAAIVAAEFRWEGV